MQRKWISCSSLWYGEALSHIRGCEADLVIELYSIQAEVRFL